MGYASFIKRQLLFKAPGIPPDLDLSGQTILITGASSGIGHEVARIAVRHHAELVILAVRSREKGQCTVEEIRKAEKVSQTRMEVWDLDMSDFDSVLGFGKQVQTLARLDMVFENAGVFLFDWQTSKETGIEQSLQVNHLSTALLSLLLLPVLRRSSGGPSRPTHLVMTSSEVHMWTPFREQQSSNILDRLNDREHFSDAMDRYSVSKLLNVFWTRELVRRQPGGDVIITMVNPGSVNTGLHRDGPQMMQLFDRVVGRTAVEAANLVFDAALHNDQVYQGQYLSEAKIVK